MAKSEERREGFTEFCKSGQRVEEEEEEEGGGRTWPNLRREMRREEGFTDFCKSGQRVEEEEEEEEGGGITWPNLRREMRREEFTEFCKSAKAEKNFSTPGGRGGEG